MPARECSRTACSRPAVSTLTYNYADSTAVLGPLSRASEPHSYDLCAEHSAGLTVPRGWRAIRVPGSDEATDDLVALADALRPRSASAPGPEQPPSAPAHDRDAPARHRPETASGPRHLHVVRSPHE